MSRLHLDAGQRRRLRRQLAAAGDVRVYRRTLALLELDRGRPAGEVAAALGVARETVQRWAARFRRSGRPSDLADAPRPGRPPLLDGEALGFLDSVLARAPQDLGLPHTAWKVPLLCRLLAIGTGREPSGDTVRRVLADWGYAWKRPRYVLAPDPEREKKRRILGQLRALPGRSVVPAEDETDLLLFPPLRAGWAPRGEPAKVLLTGWNARRVVFGAMNLRTGTRLFLARPKGRGAEFREFLRLVRSAYRGRHVAMVLDENPSHTAGESLKAARGMTLLWLPKRSPELNPMDTLWGQAKDAFSANKQYATVEEQAERFLDYLGRLPNGRALETSGVLSEDFWLKDAL